MPQPTLFNFFQKAKPKSGTAVSDSARSVLTGDSEANTRNNTAFKSSSPHVKAASAPLSSTPKSTNHTKAASTPASSTPKSTPHVKTAKFSLAKRRLCSQERSEKKKYRRVRLASDSDENGAQADSDAVSAECEEQVSDGDVSPVDSDEEFKPCEAESSSDSMEGECVASDAESPPTEIAAKRRVQSQLLTPTTGGKRLAGRLDNSAMATPGSTGVSSPRTPTSAVSLKRKLSSFSAESPSEFSPSSSVSHTPGGAVGGGANSENNWPHLSFDWLKPERVRDAEGRRPDHPDYSPRTLRVPLDFLDKQTPAMRQWWVLKSSHFDCVLFFKMGKFYEMFHMDAVLCVKELGLLYMKGEHAHVGFPEASFSRYSSALIAKGHTVCRIEQTETPDMMQRRVAQASRVTRFDRVVAREICQLTSPGTRTYSAIEGDCADSGLNYLMAVKYKECDGRCQFGVCFVDTSVGQFNLGQFDDDCHCSRLRTLFAHHTPVQLLLSRGGDQLCRSVLGSQLAAAGCSVDSLRPTTEFWTAESTLKRLAELDCFTGKEGATSVGGEGKGDDKDYVSTPVNSEDTDIADGWPLLLVSMTSDNDSLHQTARTEYDLALQSLGAVLWYLQRSLLDVQLVSMKRFCLYVPPDVEVSEGGAGSVRFSQVTDSGMSDSTDSAAVDGDSAIPPTEFLTPLPKHMVLDGVTVANLELLCNSLDGSTEGSLLGVLDTCATPFGKRLLRAWLCAPLTSAESINTRLDAVHQLMHQPEVMKQLTGQLRLLPDLDRQLRRMHVLGNARLGGADHPSSRAIMFEGAMYSRARVNDFLSALSGFELLNKLVTDHGSLMSCSLLKSCFSFEEDGGKFPRLSESLRYFQEAFDQEQARKDGRVLPSAGVDEQYDNAVQQLKQITARADQYLSQQNRHFGSKVVYFGSGRNGYQLELSDSASKKVDSSYELQSQRKGFKRYWTDVTKELLADRLTAEDELSAALSDVSRRLFASFCQQLPEWQRAVDCAALLDVLLALARYSNSLQTSCRPELLTAQHGPVLELTECGHPWLGRTQFGSQAGLDFIANDIGLTTPRSMMLLTGPNMGGKSTLMRQAGLAVILAQMGCYVPAASARLTPVDRVFTRLGAQDRISSGQSTFHVELSETAAILCHATSRSLVLIDELGRGTSTFDGSAIASAVMRQLLRIGSMAIFSTHYHSLVGEFEQFSRQVWLAHMACMVENEGAEDPTEQSITFLYRLADGACPRSYGFNVAQLAGLPLAVIRNAHQRAGLLQRRVDSVARFCHVWKQHSCGQTEKV